MELVVGSPIQSLSVRTQWWGWFLGVVEGGVRGAWDVFFFFFWFLYPTTNDGQ